MRIINVFMLSVIFLCIGVITGVFITIYNAYSAKQKDPDIGFIFGITIRLLSKFIKGGQR